MFLGLQQTRRKSITVKIRVYSWGYSNISGDFKGGFIQESTLKTLFSLENVFYLFSFRVTKYFQATTYKGEKTVIRKYPCIIPGVIQILIVILRWVRLEGVKHESLQYTVFSHLYVVTWKLFAESFFRAAKCFWGYNKRGEKALL